MLEAPFTKTGEVDDGEEVAPLPVAVAVLLLLVEVPFAKGAVA
jgi:hypothetical protein